MGNPYVSYFLDDLDIVLCQGQNHDFQLLLFCVYMVTILRTF